MANKQGTDMDNNQDEILVTITGGNSIVREYATGLVATAFEQGAFTNVATLNPAAEPIVYPEVSSMYDLVQAHAPHLLKTPVKIQGSFANFQNLDAKGAFGPVRVGEFEWDAGQLYDVGTYTNNAQGVRQEGIYTLYASEKDAACILDLKKKEEEANIAWQEREKRLLEERAKLTPEQRLNEARRTLSQMHPAGRGY